MRNLQRKVRSQLERVDRWVSVLMGVAERQMKLEGEVVGWIGLIEKVARGAVRGEKEGRD